MKRQPITLFLTTAAVTVFASACQDSPAVPFSPDDPVGPGPSAQVALRGAPGQGELVDRIPGFAGLYLDESGAPVVNVVGPADAGEVDGAIRSFLGEAAGGGRAIRTQAVEYTLPELNGWFEAASPAVLEVQGALFVDLDERANRVTIGVDDDALIERTRQIAERLGVPREAVRVVVTDPILNMNSLQDLHRPTVGGLQIHFSNFLCTLGFNATAGASAQVTPQANGNGKGGGNGGGRGGGNQPPPPPESFITNSHCTDRQGGVEDTQYFQPLQSVDPTAIATEVADPKYVKSRDNPACPRGASCRLSDASRAAYATGATFTLGAIAKPDAGPNVGSVAWAGGGQFAIVAEGTAVVGQIVNKVGRTTGWTQGTVTATNVDTGVQGSNIVLLGQSFVEDLTGGAVVVGGGDSGSSVFSLAGDNATLVGLLWGGNGAGTLFVFSPLANIEAELGPLTTF